jgi:hypothetical protein
MPILLEERRLTTKEHVERVGIKRRNSEQHDVVSIPMNSPGGQNFNIAAFSFLILLNEKTTASPLPQSHLLGG